MLFPAPTQLMSPCHTIFFNEMSTEVCKVFLENVLLYRYGYAPCPYSTSFFLFFPLLKNKGGMCEKEQSSCNEVWRPKNNNHSTLVKHSQPSTDMPKADITNQSQMCPRQRSQINHSTVPNEPRQGCLRISFDPRASRSHYQLITVGLCVKSISHI